MKYMGWCPFPSPPYANGSLVFGHWSKCFFTVVGKESIGLTCRSYWLRIGIHWVLVIYFITLLHPLLHIEYFFSDSRPQAFPSITWNFILYNPEHYSVRWCCYKMWFSSIWQYLSTLWLNMYLSSSLGKLRCWR